MPTLFLKQRPKGKPVWLRCLACGRSFRQQAPNLFLDLGTVERKQRGEKLPFSAYYVPTMVVCPHCRVEDRYDLGRLQALVAAGMVFWRRFFGQRPGGWFQVLFLGSRDGRILHPFEMRAEYAQQVAQNPNNPELRLRYANTLRSQGRAEEAEAQYRATLKLSPRQSEALINLAALLGQRGEREEATAVLRRLVRIKAKNKAQREQVLMAQEVLDGKLAWDELEVGNPTLPIIRE